jgi:hypothetical protein
MRARRESLPEHHRPSEGKAGAADVELPTSSTSVLFLGNDYQSCWKMALSPKLNVKKGLISRVRMVVVKSWPVTICGDK